MCHMKGGHTLAFARSTDNSNEPVILQSFADGPNFFVSRCRMDKLWLSFLSSNQTRNRKSQSRVPWCPKLHINEVDQTWFRCRSMEKQNTQYKNHHYE